MKKIIISALCALALGGISLAATHDKCTEAKTEWQAKKILKAKIEKEGAKVKTIRVKGGCYSVTEVGADGKKMHATYNPKSLEKVQ